ncbi:hypothetical protein SAMN02745165_00403 [Malonomonas rubra DSM 5091]|uniref:Uncharacterized protein n=1 Tax=Malonomonas rubra DSM 5091 TaxID=1122189 RepID=A0A1M6C503_MALRU|nr:hypothetical protein [Malonomonas rubra]SHI55881.1 hypothetical protein SAMN02745165_00403 [Malonomonas rubra DSM 5091]
MIDQAPFIVLLISPSPGVGKSTLGKNLPVYLKGLKEDLPVAYLTDERAGVKEMFALPGQRVVSLLSSEHFADQLSLGEYGIEYAFLERVSQDFSAFFTETKYPGVVLVDLAIDHPAVTELLSVADLLLMPVKNPADLGKVVRLRKQLAVTTGNSDPLWLLPSELGGGGDYQAAAQSLDFLRFAADERDLQVLELTYQNDQRVAQQACGGTRSVLTRLPQSPVHYQLQQLAEFVLQQLGSEQQLQRRLAGLAKQKRLPKRAALVSLNCPLCGRAVALQDAHYLESIPTRKRFLLHADCMLGALKNISGKDFLSSFGLALLFPASYLGGKADQAKLLLLDRELGLLEGEEVGSENCPQLGEFFHAVTGRYLPELYQDFLLISPARPVEELLSADWYRSFCRLRRDLRQAWDEEKIV